MNTSQSRRAALLQRRYDGLRYLLMGALAGLGSIMVPGYVPWLQSWGLTLHQITTLEGSFLISALIASCASGAIASRCGKRRTIAGGAALLCAGLLVHAYSEAFWGFFVAEQLIAVGGSLTVLEHFLMHENFVLMRKSHRTVRMRLIRATIYFATSALALVVGGMIGEVSLQIPFIIGSLTMLLYLLIGLRVGDGDPSAKATVGVRHLVGIAHLAVRESGEVRWLLLSGSGMIALAHIGAMFRISYATDVWGVHQANLGTFVAAVLLLGSLISSAIGRRLSATQLPRVSVCLILAAACAYTVLAVRIHIASMMLFSILVISGTIAETVIGDRLLKLMRKEHRLLLYPLPGTCSRGLSAVVILPLGSIADRWGVTTVCLLSAFLALGIAAIVYQRGVMLHCEDVGIEE